MSRILGNALYAYRVSGFRLVLRYLSRVRHV
jgi:hypothetical protein